MSVSEMNLSWSTLSGRQSLKSQNSSVFLTSDKKSSTCGNTRAVIRSQRCVSAKISGMRFQGWREPKPLRSRCGSAVYITHDDYGDKVLSSPRKEPKPQTNSKQILLDEQDSSKPERVNRLSQHTLSSKHKSSRARPREANVDMNWYSWSKMNVYKDYQAVIYKDNGTLRPKSFGKAR